MLVRSYRQQKATYMPKVTQQQLKALKVQLGQQLKTARARMLKQISKSSFVILGTVQLCPVPFSYCFVNLISYITNSLQLLVTVLLILTFSYCFGDQAFSSCSSFSSSNVLKILFFSYYLAFSHGSVNLSLQLLSYIC